MTLSRFFIRGIGTYNGIVESREETDVRLARALLEGRMEAFDEFVETFRRRIFQYSYTMCGQREDAEEVAQDTLMKVFENFASLKDPEHVRAWVFRIAKNACLMKRRKSMFAPEHELSLDEYMHPHHDTGERDVAGHEVMQDTAVYQKELQGALRRAIRELPENYRAVILLRDVEELSTEDTAEILEVSTDVVKQRLHRARLALRKILEGETLHARVH